MEYLSPREREKICLSHQEPDRVPMDIGEGRQTSIYVEPYLRAIQLLGLEKAEIITSPRNVVDSFDERFLSALGIDFRRVSLREIPEALIPEAGGIVRDEWGIGWQKAGHFWSPVHHPLRDATLDDLLRYPFPDPMDERRFKGIREEAEFKWNKTRYALVAKQPNHTYGVLTQSIYLRGAENFFIDLMINKAFASELMEKVLEYHIRLYERYLDEVGDFMDIVHTSDDLGTQTSTYFSLSLFREMIKPKEKRLMDSIKNKTDAKILFHCDGAISAFIDDLIEIGVDILNPVEPMVKGMDPLVLKKNFGDRLSFHGGISQQQTLSAGTVRDVDVEVERRIKELAPGGGYLLASAQTVMPEVPGENVIQMFRAAERHGRYPIGKAAEQ